MRMRRLFDVAATAADRSLFDDTRTQCSVRQGKGRADSSIGSYVTLASATQYRRLSCLYVKDMYLHTHAHILACSKTCKTTTDCSLYGIVRVFVLQVELKAMWFSGHNFTASGRYEDKSTLVASSYHLKLLIQSPSFHEINLGCSFHRDREVLRLEIKVRKVAYGKKGRQMSTGPAKAMPLFATHSLNENWP